MNRSQAFLWISGWSVPKEIWKPFWPAFPVAKHLALSFESCQQVEQITEQATTALHQIDERQVTIVGWSLGAMVALQLAFLFPERIRNLYLISAVARFSKNHIRRMKKELWKDPVEIIRDFDQKMFSPIEQQEGHLLKWLKFRKEIPSVASLQAGLDYLHQFSVAEQAKAIQQPVFLLSGGEDPICPSPATLTLANQLSHATRTIWQHHGHACFWTQRERFVQWISEGVSREH